VIELILIYLLLKEDSRAKQRNKCLDGFRAGSEIRDDAVLRQCFELARLSVMTELTEHSSVGFVGEDARICPDGLVRGVGQFDFSGKDGARSRNWYLVTIDPQWSINYFDLFEADPASLADRDSQRAASRAKILWAILWILLAILFVGALALRFLA
jgi:hypothetical protein